jgi:cellulose synthase/poly-beta-1,6-N-acetylglucosamine synthase-like glycosyltransferase
VAKSFGAEVENFGFHSKWKTLAALARHVKKGEWVALVDAGSLWPPELLSDLVAEFQDPSLLAIAPAYYPKNASSLERLLWRFEARCKVRENRAGGPVSVHGASVFFRAEALQAALERLSRFNRTAWLNDDIVIPFAARLAYPGSAIRYWCPPDLERRVSDAGLRESAPQFRRRRRMVAGNLEWAITLFPAAVRRSPAAALVALRRLLRIFWAYWVLCLLYAFYFAILSSRGLAFLALAATIAGLSSIFTVTGKRSLLEAAAASLLSPIFLPSVWSGRSQTWS